MLDSSQFPHHSALAWQSQLQPGDLVLFRFPAAGRVSGGSPAPRPCLLLDLEVAAGRRCALLAPGFPVNQAPTSRRTIPVVRGPDYRAAGLDRPTLFPIRSRLLVPLAHDGFFSPPGTGSPVFGRLPEAALEQMHAERARLHALRDIRADRAQSEGRRRHRRVSVRGHEVLVERRNVRRPLPMKRGTTAQSGT